MKLYRAAKDDYMDQGYCFASSRSDAAEYLNNPGFGGPVLFVTDVSVDESRVLRLTGSPRQCWRELIESVLGLDAQGQPGDCVGSFLGVAGRFQRTLAESFDWVVFTDSHPEDCETWMFLSGDEPVLASA